MLLTPEDTARLTRRFGGGVTPWLDALPALVSALADHWSLRIERLMPGGTSATYLCASDNGSVVLKVTPDHDIAALEATALEAWAGVPAMVELIGADLGRGALLLAAVEPGAPAAEPAKVLPHLHSADPMGFPPLWTRVDFLFETVLTHRTGTYYATEHAHARKLAHHDTARVLLHGDMHPGNVLQGAHGPVAIDPRPCVGDPAFDWCDFVHLDYDLHGADVDLDRVHEWLTVFRPFYG